MKWNKDKTVQSVGEDSRKLLSHHEVKTNQVQETVNELSKRAGQYKNWNNLIKAIFVQSMHSRFRLDLTMVVGTNSDCFF